jgi:hypothetical protein
MPQDLATLSGRPKIREYAQGRARDATGEIAEFLSPTVEVSSYVGKYSKYDETTRFKIPETLRSLGGDATQLSFAKTDQNFDCEPHALDVPLDNIEIDEASEAEGEDLLMEAADESAALGGMAHESRVIDTALTAVAATGGKGNWTGAAVDPVDELNQAIQDVYLAAGGFPSIEVGILLDPAGLRMFFANAKVKGYFPGAKEIAPSIENIQRLLIGKTDVRTTWLAIDTAAPGLAPNMQFKLSNKVIIFARSKTPTRRDPSFMKTFRRRGRWMIPGVYEKQDGRGKVVKMDWSEDIKIANALAAKRYDLS